MLRRIKKRQKYDRARTAAAFRVIRDRHNPLEVYSDAELLRQYRFDGNHIRMIADLLRNSLEHKDGRGGALTLIQQACVALKFFASGAFQVNIAEMQFNIHESTVSRTVKNVSFALAHQMNQHIYFPSGAAAAANTATFYSRCKFPNIIGAVDGTQIPIQQPSIDGFAYFNRKQFYAINVQAVAAADGTFCDVVAKYPGSVHDSRIFKESRLCTRLEMGQLNGVLLGDSGYTLSNFMLTPYPVGTTNVERTYQRLHGKGRVVVERAFGILKRRFPCLKLDLRVNLDRIPAVIASCFILHNLALRWKQPMPDDVPPVPAPHQAESDDEDDGLAIDSPPPTAAAFRNWVAMEAFQVA